MVLKLQNMIRDALSNVATKKSRDDPESHCIFRMRTVFYIIIIVIRQIDGSIDR